MALGRVSAEETSQADDRRSWTRITREMYAAEQLLRSDSDIRDAIEKQQLVERELEKLLRSSRESGQPLPGGLRPSESAGAGSVASSPSKEDRAEPGKKASGTPGTTPATAVDATGPTELIVDRAPPPVVENVRRSWGELPEQLRMSLLEIPVDHFLPEYQQVIEDYFRRLASEQQHGDDGIP
ncbi:MAG: hypothetical protein R3E01_23120 [Pirellulaceae bacterium]|nr:hypothetical protein [Planctomycetales bacterium]